MQATKDDLGLPRYLAESLSIIGKDSSLNRLLYARETDIEDASDTTNLVDFLFYPRRGDSSVFVELLVRSNDQVVVEISIVEHNRYDTCEADQGRW